MGNRCGLPTANGGKSDPWQEDVSEARVLNRVIRCLEDGWEIEADQRHVDMIVQEMGMDDAKPVSTPGEPEHRWEEEENAKPF